MCDLRGRLLYVGEGAMCKLLALSFLIASVSGCQSGTLQDRLQVRRVTGKTLGDSAWGAFWNPQTLVPLAGAVLFGLEDFDEKGSQWAIKHRPVFKTPARANQVADGYLAGLAGEALGTLLLRPAQEPNEAWLDQKAGHLAAEGIAVGTTYAAIQGLKEAIGRTGPDGWKDTAMPSGHSSGAFLFSTLSNRNMDAMMENRALRVPLQISNIALASGVAWARVEGGHHYPSDALAGAALGHFMAAFIHDVFLDTPSLSTVTLALNTHAGGAAVTLGLRF